MYIKLSGRHNGKEFTSLCEMISCLQTEIETLKKLNLSYKAEEQEYNKLCKKLDNLKRRNEKEEF